jgi:hypothetical protein
MNDIKCIFTMVDITTIIHFTDCYNKKLKLFHKLEKKYNNVFNIIIFFSLLKIKRYFVCLKLKLCLGI